MARYILSDPAYSRGLNKSAHVAGLILVSPTFQLHRIVYSAVGDLKVATLLHNLAVYSPNASSIAGTFEQLPL